MTTITLHRDRLEGLLRQAWLAGMACEATDAGNAAGELKHKLGILMSQADQSAVKASVRLDPQAVLKALTEQPRGAAEPVDEVADKPPVVVRQRQAPGAATMVV